MINSDVDDFHVDLIADARQTAEAMMPVVAQVMREARRRGDTVEQQERDVEQMLAVMRARLLRSFAPQLVEALIQETRAAYRATAAARSQ